MITKATFVGAGFTRKPPKYERFIRPSGLRFTKAHVTHPELKCTFNLEIIGVKKNPNGPMYTSLGVLTKGTIIEVLASYFFFLFSQPQSSDPNIINLLVCLGVVYNILCGFFSMNTRSTAVSLV